MRPLASIFAIFLTGSILGTGASFGAAATKLLGKHQAWDASVRTVGKEKVCYISSLPKKSTGKYKTRGEVSVIVAHWPKRKRWAEVTINAGYRYKKKSEVLVRIAGGDHRLFTEGEQAFAYQNEDAKLLRAMRAGASMAVAGISARGTKTIDLYSLKGISAALKAIDKECRGKAKKRTVKRKRKRRRKR